MTEDKKEPKIEEQESESESADNIAQQQELQKKETVPPEGYTCKVCGVGGHWIQQCPQKKRRRRGGRNPSHVYRPGVDPSPKDIELAKKMQAIVPPPCDCGIKSRLKKVKRSKVTPNSRANGSYFFFCSKKKDDITKCNFAQPVEETQKTEKDKAQAHFYARKRKGLIKK